MKLSVIAASELDAGLDARWQALRRTSETYGRPFYHPGFTRLAARHRPALRIAVIEDAGMICGFLPHEVDQRGALQPVGLFLNDYHGVIAAPDQGIAVAELLRTCGARYWHFDHMPKEFGSTRAWVMEPTVSPYMDFAGGFTQYVERLARYQGVTKTPGVITSVRKSANRLKRDVGELRLDWSRPEPDLLEWIMRLKSEQWHRSGRPQDDAFAIPWVRSFMQDGLSFRDGDFGGTLSALYAGDRLIAAHFGFSDQQHGILHGSFATFEPELGYYMPGSVLIQQFAEHGAAGGFRLFDMGRGSQDYKMRFATGHVDMGEGAVSRPQWIADTAMAGRRSWRNAKQRIKAVPWVERWRARRKAEST